MANPTSGSSDAVVLRPSYALGAGVTALGGFSLALLAGFWAGAPRLALIAAGTVGIFGLFLLLQTALLRLEFGEEALLVWRQSTLIRSFPYREWLSWKLFWPALPALFYFREQRSIHFLPVLFDATSLQQQLELHVKAPLPDLQSSDV